MRLAHRQAHGVSRGRELVGAVEHELEPAFQDVEILILVGMNMRRHEGAGRKRRMPREAVFGASLRHIGLAENVPANSLNAFIRARDAGDLGFHVVVSFLSSLPAAFSSLENALLTCPARSPWRNGRRNSRTPSGRSRSGISHPDVLRPLSGKNPGSYNHSR